MKSKTTKFIYKIIICITVGILILLTLAPAVSVITRQRYVDEQLAAQEAEQAQQTQEEQNPESQGEENAEPVQVQIDASDIGEDGTLKLDLGN